ncbi:hypothetical protein BT63DRAFT_419428 [Microthyrium microscopicum]|uniref:Alpha N-terminal protein methyltransferase 1 n=1 Tax=Microthyrium microscopicum TaxID=703497 RepID=A0A6A6USP8_9PEZI|nr:hypothetical protein BT63DRAFT_419428 [Microthyrium microscopicum]
MSTDPPPPSASHDDTNNLIETGTDAALAYWAAITPDDAGVLGGYPAVSRADLRGSAAFLAKLRRKSLSHAAGAKLSRVVDVGAGIGRVTKGFLANVAKTVDVVEPVQKLTHELTHGEAGRTLRETGTLGEVYNVGAQEWTPESGRMYDVVWTQWCVGQVTDLQLVEYLQRVQKNLVAGGWIVVKENLSTEADGSDIFDETDRSVTRADGKFRDIFEHAGLDIVATEVQRGLPKELYPVRSYALQPKRGKSAAT